MMTLREYVDLNAVGRQPTIFEALNSMGRYSFTYYHKDLDDIMVRRFGERIVAPWVEGVKTIDLAAMLMKEFGAKWNYHNDIRLNRLDLTASNTRVIDESGSTTTTNTTTTEMINKTSAYNSELMVDTDGGDSSVDSSERLTNTRTMSDGYVSVKAAYDNLDIIGKNEIITIAISDVVHYTTLDIY